MEVDTGAATSVMSESLLTELWPGRSLEPTTVRLKSYTKEEIPLKHLVASFQIRKSPKMNSLELFNLSDPYTNGRRLSH